MNSDLLYTWEDSVENFRKYVAEWCGVKQGTDDYSLVTKAVKTMNDLDRFIDLYDGNYDNIVNTVKKMLVLSV